MGNGLVVPALCLTAARRVSEPGLPFRQGRNMASRDSVFQLLAETRDKLRPIGGKANIDWSKQTLSPLGRLQFTSRKRPCCFHKVSEPSEVS